MTERSLPALARALAGIPLSFAALAFSASTLAGTITVLQGDNQHARAGAWYPGAIIVKATNDQGAPVGGVLTITFPSASAPTRIVNAFPSFPPAPLNGDGTVAINGLIAAGDPGTVDLALSVGAAASGILRLHVDAGAPARVEIISGASTSIPRGTAANHTIAARVTDASGAPVPYADVRVATDNQGGSGPWGSFAGTWVWDHIQAGADGVVGLPQPLIANNVLGTWTATVSSYGNSATVSVTNIDPPPPAPTLQIFVNTYPIGINRTGPVEVYLRDASGNPMAGRTVTFTSPNPANAAGGSITPSAVTDAAGRAVAMLTANAFLGSYNATAQYESATVALPIANIALAGDPSYFDVVSTWVPQQSPPGTYFAMSPGVYVLDGNTQTPAPVAGVEVVFRTPGIANGAWEAGGGSLTNTVTALTNAQGIATAPPMVAGSASGPFNVTISVARVPYYNREVTLTVAGAAPMRVDAIAGGSQSAQPGSQLPQPFVARVFDASGAPVPRARVVWTSPTSGASGTFAGGNPAVLMTEANGTVIAPSFMLNSTPGSFMVTATCCNGAQVGFPVTTLGVPPPPPTEGPTRTISGTSPSGGTVSITISSGAPDCSLVDTAFIDPRVVLFAPDRTPPPNLSFPDGFVQLEARNCGVGRQVAFTWTSPRTLSAGTTFWRFGRTREISTPHWHSVPTQIAGNAATFVLFDGDFGDDDLTANGTVRTFGGLVPRSQQDLWWAGPAENGWGMSIVQHGDTFFAVIYGYAASGAPTWWVMSGGTWNAAHTAYTGAVYTPRGSPYFAYDPSRLVVGAPVGTITLTFTGEDTATLDYTIEGVTGRKSIRRQGFGPQAGFARPGLGDMWWGGGAQSGWGIAVLQQYATLFSIWFTYDANGIATWFVMPSGTWTSADTYEGRIYRTRGSPWLGIYDPGALQVIDVGSFRLRFTSDQATFNYEIDGRTGSLPLTRQGF